MKEKQLLRRAARKTRHDQSDKDSVSQLIINRLTRMPLYCQAAKVMWYVDVRDEVRTRRELPKALAINKQIVVPYCVGNDLGLFRLQKMGDLSIGAFGILEPRGDLRGQEGRSVDPTELDLVVVPGVAFDESGGRLGHGAGFYDRLLARVSPKTVLVGVAYERQVITAVPTSDHDIAMNWIVTEGRTICCQGGLGVRADGEGC